MTRMTRKDWMAREADARAAASRWAEVAAEHEAAARRDPWSKSNMIAMQARDNEVRCCASAAHAREMACDVR